MNVRGWRQSNASGIRILAALFNPSNTSMQRPGAAKGMEWRATNDPSQ
jgi:hypothetical protein